VWDQTKFTEMKWKVAHFNRRQVLRSPAPGTTGESWEETLREEDMLTKGQTLPSIKTQVGFSIFFLPT